MNDESHREAVSMVTDHRDACQAAVRPLAVWWPLSADGKMEEWLEADHRLTRQVNTFSDMGRCSL